MTRNVLSFLLVVGLCHPLIAQQRRATERAATVLRPAASDPKSAAPPETPAPERYGDAIQLLHSLVRK